MHNFAMVWERFFLYIQEWRGKCTHPFQFPKEKQEFIRPTFGASALSIVHPKWASWTGSMSFGAINLALIPSRSIYILIIKIQWSWNFPMNISDFIRKVSNYSMEIWTCHVHILFLHSNTSELLRLHSFSLPQNKNDGSTYKSSA